MESKWLDMDRLYWFIVSDDEEYMRDYEYVYTVQRKCPEQLVFVFKTRDLANKCAKRLRELYPAETIIVRKQVVRTEYR